MRVEVGAEEVALGRAAGQHRVTMCPEGRRVPVDVFFRDHSLFQVGISRDGERQ